MRRWATVLGLLVGCGGSDAAPDATTSGEADAQLPGPHAVTVSGNGATFLAYRDGNGPWRTPRQLVDGEYAIDITSDYLLVTGCSDDTGFEVSIEASTWADGDDVFTYCGSGSSSGDPTVSVTGQMIQPGSVFLYDLASSDTGPWSFDLDVPPGPHDLFGVTSDRVLVRRNLSLTADTAVADLDVVQDGQPLDFAPLVLGGIAGSEAISTQTLWFTGNDLAFLDRASADAPMPPDALLDPSDFLFLSVSVDGGDNLRTASTLFTGSENVYEFPPVLTGVTFTDALEATWDSLPRYTNLSYYVTAETADTYSYLEVFASERWIQATGAERLAFDLDIPDIDPSWTIDLGDASVRSFRLSDSSGDISYSTAIRETLNGAPSHALEPHRSRAELRRVAEKAHERKLSYETFATPAGRTR